VNSSKKVSFRNLLCLAFIVSLPTLILLAPSRMVSVAGSAAWVSGCLSFIPLFLYFSFLCFFLKNRREGEGLGEVILRATGPVAGRAALILILLLQIFYAAAVACKSAINCSAAIYPLSDPLFFICALMLVCFLAAMGKARTLIRTACRAVYLMVFVTAVVVILAVFAIDRRDLLPVSYLDTVPVLEASTWGIRIMGVYGAIFFFLGEVPTGNEAKNRKSAIFLCVCAALTLTLICACIQGFFGKELSGKLTMPFLSLVRNLRLFSSLGRFEALVVSIWAFGDFFLIATMVMIAAKNLQLIFNCKTPDERGKRLPLFRQGRWSVWFSGALTFFLAVRFYFLPQLQFDYLRYDVVALAIYIALLILLPAIFIIGKARKKI
jgi:hypothetical protein